MLLTVDIGNTSITLGVFDNNDVVHVSRIPSDVCYLSEKYEELLQDSIDFDINGCIISSVVNGLDIVLSKAIKNIFGVECLILSKDLNLGIKLSVENENELGADRIANGVAACKMYKSPIIVIDFGTANTFDIVNSKGKFIGGIISPGINTQLESLSNKTSKLPSITPGDIKKVIGTNTIECIMSGVIQGTACMIDGMIDKCEKELGEKASIVVTGGNGKLISKYMSRKIDDINPNLTLQGLKLVYELNSHLICSQRHAL